MSLCRRWTGKVDAKEPYMPTMSYICLEEDCGFCRDADAVIIAHQSISKGFAVHLAG